MRSRYKIWNTAEIMTEVLQKCFLSSPLPNISFLSKHLNLIGCHGNRKAIFENKYSKIISSEAVWGTKLNFVEMFIALAFTKQNCFYCRCLCAFVAMAFVPLTYNGESEN